MDNIKEYISDNMTVINNALTKYLCKRYKNNLEISAKKIRILYNLGKILDSVGIVEDKYVEKKINIYIALFKTIIIKCHLDCYDNDIINEIIKKLYATIKHISIRYTTYKNTISTKENIHMITNSSASNKQSSSWSIDIPLCCKKNNHSKENIKDAQSIKQDVQQNIINFTDSLDSTLNKYIDKSCCIDETKNQDLLPSKNTIFDCSKETNNICNIKTTSNPTVCSNTIFESNTEQLKSNTYNEKASNNDSFSTHHNLSNKKQKTSLHSSFDSTTNSTDKKIIIDNSTNDTKSKVNNTNNKIIIETDNNSPNKHNVTDMLNSIANGQYYNCTFNIKF